MASASAREAGRTRVDTDRLEMGQGLIGITTILPVVTGTATEAATLARPDFPWFEHCFQVEPSGDERPVVALVQPAGTSTCWPSLAVLLLYLQAPRI